MWGGGRAGPRGRGSRHTDGGPEPSRAVPTRTGGSEPPRPPDAEPRQTLPRTRPISGRTLLSSAWSAPPPRSATLLRDLRDDGTTSLTTTGSRPTAGLRERSVLLPRTATDVSLPPQWAPRRERSRRLLSGCSSAVPGPWGSCPRPARRDPPKRPAARRVPPDGNGPAHRRSGVDRPGAVRGHGLHRSPPPVGRGRRKARGLPWFGRAPAPRHARHGRRPWPEPAARRGRPSVPAERPGRRDDARPRSGTRRAHEAAGGRGIRPAARPTGRPRSRRTPRRRSPGRRPARP